jgi:hypothetical protein
LAKVDFCAIQINAKINFLALRMSVQRWLNFVVWAAQSAAQTTKDRSARCARNDLSRLSSSRFIKAGGDLLQDIAEAFEIGARQVTFASVVHPCTHSATQDTIKGELGPCQVLLKQLSNQ